MFLKSFICSDDALLIGKNPYASSVLRRVELKLDGRDTENTRYTYVVLMIYLFIYCVQNVFLHHWTDLVDFVQFHGNC